MTTIIGARSILAGLLVSGAAFGMLEACSSSSTTTTTPGTDSGVTTVRSDSGDGTGTDSGGGGGTDSGGDTDAGSVPANGGPGDFCTGSGTQGSCATGGICETFPAPISVPAGDHCTKPCTMPGVDPDPECQDAGAVFSGKCTGKSYCQIP
jgi:hypothetical protein